MRVKTFSRSTNALKCKAILHHFSSHPPQTQNIKDRSFPLNLSCKFQMHYVGGNKHLSVLVMSKRAPRLSPQTAEVSPVERDTPWHRWYSSPVGFPLKSQLIRRGFFLRCVGAVKQSLVSHRSAHSSSMGAFFPLSCVDLATGFLQAIPLHLLLLSSDA